MNKIKAEMMKKSISDEFEINVFAALVIFEQDKNDYNLVTAVRSAINVKNTNLKSVKILADESSKDETTSNKK